MLVSLDYSQIELRLLTEFADLPAMEQAFREGTDIHAATASEMFGVPLAEMTPGVRRQAKAVNFGVIYGISGFGLARNLRIPRDEAQGFIDRYFERFPGIRDYMADTTAYAKAHGHVLTLFGRKIHTPEISASGPRAGFARRAAINAPIQGTAADVIRRAMVRMEAATEGLDAKMLLQVHDELLFEVAEGERRRAHRARARGDGGRQHAGGEAFGAAGRGRGAGAQLGGGALMVSPASPVRLRSSRFYAEAYLPYSSVLGFDWSSTFECLALR